MYLTDARHRAITNHKLCWELTPHSQQQWQTGVHGRLTPPPGPDRRQSCAGRHQVNKQQRSFQTRLAAARGNRPTTTGKKEKESDLLGPLPITNHRVQQQSQLNPKHMSQHTCTLSHTYTEQIKRMGH